MNAPALYRKYFIDAGIERTDLFRNVRNAYACARALYPGSFAHVVPSFFIPEVAYLDTDKRCKGFFADPGTLEYVRSARDYEGEPIIRFHQVSYEEELPERPGYFDLLISQYAGFISRHCTKYLRPGGYLLANDSHGDATLAFHSGDYRLVAVVDERMRIVGDGLERYFKPSRNRAVDLGKVLATMKGPKYVCMADSYVFQRIGG